MSAKQRQQRPNLQGSDKGWIKGLQVFSITIIMACAAAINFLF
jgi:hypothetical protein